MENYAENYENYGDFVRASVLQLALNSSVVTILLAEGLLKGNMRFVKSAKLSKFYIFESTSSI